MEKYNCLICKKEVENDGYCQENICGMVFRSHGNWFGHFDCAIMSGFDRDVGVEIGICEECLVDNIDYLKLTEFIGKKEKVFLDNNKLKQAISGELNEL